MKKFFSILLVLTLLLSGCSLTVGPASIPTQDTQSTGTTTSTDLSGTTSATSNMEPTQSSVAALDWSSDPYLSLLPEMEVEAVWNLFDAVESSITIETVDLSLSAIKDYIQVLVDVGFSLDQFSWKRILVDVDGEKENYSFTARDAHWNVVQLICNYIAAPGQPAKWQCCLSVYRWGTDTTPPANAVENSAAWDADPLRAQVPAPPTEYWDQSADQVDLPYLGLDQIRAYADQLQGAGFTYNKHVYLDMTQNIYEFIARNAEGYTVRIYHYLESNSMTVYPPGNDNVSSWDNVVPEYFPEPEVKNWSYSYLPVKNETIYLYGMDYQQALAYLEHIKQTNLSREWKFEYDENAWVQDEANQQIYCEFGVWSLAANGVDYDIGEIWTLIYNPANTECTCTLVMS